jgi:preprotein translocase SecE subunit
MSNEAIEQNGERAPRGPLGWAQRAGEFLREVRNEMKRVTWPSQREVYATTVVVILTSVLRLLSLRGRPGWQRRAVALQPLERRND